VGHQDERRAGFLTQPEQQIGDVRRAGAVEIPGRLIGQQQLRLIDDRARDRHPLPLAARKRGDPIVHAVLQPDPVEHHPRARQAARGRQAAAEQCDLDILQRRQRGDQVEFLEHDADVEAQQPRPLSSRAQHPPFPQHGPGAGMVDAAQEVDQAALAASARPHDGQAIAGRDLQIDASQCRDGAAVIAAAHATERDQRPGIRRFIGTGAALDRLTHNRPTPTDSHPPHWRCTVGPAADSRVVNAGRFAHSASSRNLTQMLRPSERNRGGQAGYLESIAQPKVSTDSGGSFSVRAERLCLQPNIKSV